MSATEIARHWRVRAQVPAALDQPHSFGQRDEACQPLGKLFEVHQPSSAIVVGHQHGSDLPQTILRRELDQEL